MPRRIFPCLAVLALIATATTSLADGLTARISTDKVALGDSVQLTLSADPAKLTAAPDISALNADFDILGTSSSTQTRIINGTRSATVAWQITLAPRSKGHLTIPVLTAGQASSDAISLDVVDATKLPAGQQRQSSTTITATLEPGNHYVQQETPLTLRITAGPGFRDAAIEAPASADYILTPRGDDRVSQQSMNGQPRTVIERDYLLRPQKAGSLTIAPFTLTAREDDSFATSRVAQSPFDRFFGQSPFGGGGSPFDQMLNPGKQIVVRTAPMTLDIMAKPAATSGWFLPAKAVTLTATWAPANPSFRVGEAVTRHIRIQALGATDVQLPDLALPQIPGAQIYLEKSESGSINTPDGTSAVRDFTYSIVPTTGGSLTLPEVTVDWFDTVSETPRTATLAAQTITVEGPAAAAPTATQVAAIAAMPITTQAKSEGQIGVFGWIVALIVTCVGAVAIGVKLWKRSGARKHDRRNFSGASQRKAAIRQIEAACRVNDTKATYAALMQWLRAVAHETGLDAGEISRKFPDFRAGKDCLEANVFSSQTAENWNKDQFLKSVYLADASVNKRHASTSHGKLPPLYAGVGPVG